MSHMVIFQTPDGNPGYNQFEELPEAVAFVEDLRNVQGVETARIFALEEVKFAFKSYFRVEVDPPMVGPAGSTAAPAASFAPASEPVTPSFEPAPSFAPAPAYEAPAAYDTGQVSAVGPGGYDQVAVTPDTSPVGTVTPLPAAYGSDQSPVGTDAPAFMAPPPPAAPETSEPTRRGLFGR